MPFGIGEYPAAYKPHIHGPYNPSINYAAPPDTKRFADVKLGELPKWLTQRNADPTKMLDAVRRSMWRYNLRWTMCKRPGVAYIFQFLTAAGVYLYYNRWYPYLTFEKHSKYHW